MSSLIELTHGYHAIVDDDDFEAVNQYQWNTAGPRPLHRSFYAQRATVLPSGKRGSQLMHLFLWERWGLKRPPTIDHVNGNGIDNRRSNLRAATNVQNLANQPPRRHNPLGLKGVIFDAFCGLYKASIMVHGRQMNLGRFKHPDAAARVRDQWAFAIYGDFAYLNFPRDAQ